MLKRAKYSFYTTKEILHSFAEKSGYPKDMIEKIYYHYIETLRKEVLETDSVAYKIGNFINLFALEGRLKYRLENSKKSKFLNAEKEKMNQSDEEKLKKIESLVEITKQVTNYEGFNLIRKTPYKNRSKLNKKILNENEEN